MRDQTNCRSDLLKDSRDCRSIDWIDRTHFVRNILLQKKDLRRTNVSVSVNLPDHSEEQEFDPSDVALDASR